MIDEKLVEKIDGEIFAAREDVIRDTIRLVNIKSVRDLPMPGAPFGVGARRVLDEFMTMASDIGLKVSDYGVGVVSGAYTEEDIDLGIWLHGDVVPEGTGWRFDPYDARVYNGCIIGRGVTDNKGQLAAIYNLFKIFKRLGITLGYNPAIYVGSCEESGMHDLVGLAGNPDAKGFLNVATPPRLSLVPDSGFPAGYGGKGGMDVWVTSDAPLSGISLTAGESADPGLAVAELFGDIGELNLPACSVERACGVTRISSYTVPRHGTQPDPEGNMITNVSSALLSAGLVSEADVPPITFIKNASLDVYGTTYGVDIDHPVMGKLTVYPKALTTDGGRVTMMLNIRYPLGPSFEEIVEKIDAVARGYGMHVSSSLGKTRPYMLDPDGPILKLLCDVAESVTREGKPPETISGSAYSHHLPNAYLYGTDANRPPEDFPDDIGWAHGVDEAASVDRLLRAMRIYARALLALDGKEW